MEPNKFIDKYIQIELVNGTIFGGECYTVDPVSGCVILIICNENEEFCTQVIMKHAIKSFKLQENECENSQNLKDFKKRLDDKLFRSSGCGGSQETTKRKEILFDWLKKNQLPVELTDTESLSVVNGMATIEPPYTVDCCRSTNTIVLDKVMKIIKACPELEG